MRRALSLAFAALCLVAAPRGAEAQRFSVTGPPKAVAVGTTTTLVVPANSNRTFLLLQNDSDTDVFCMFGTSAVAHAGFVLKTPGGGFLLDYKFNAQAINCIQAGTGTKNVIYIEGHP